MSLSRHVSSPPASVVLLRPRQSLRVDPEPLMRLRAAAGAQAAIAQVEQARDTLVLNGPLLVLPMTLPQQAEVLARLSAISAAALPIGLIDLVVVAGHARECLQRGDRHGAAATLARLGRLCQQALALTGSLNRNA